MVSMILGVSMLRQHLVCSQKITGKSIKTCYNSNDSLGEQSRNEFKCLYSSVSQLHGMKLRRDYQSIKRL